MAIELKPTTPRTQILNRRATYLGTQYTVADAWGSHIVTVNNGYIGCTCGMDAYFVTCSHIRVVEAQEQVYVEEAKRRDEYCNTFGIYA